MSQDDFLELCETKIRAYLNQPASVEYDVFAVWKSYWTVGIVQDNMEDENNKRAVFSTSLADANNAYFDCTLNVEANKLYMKVYLFEETEEYTLNAN